MPLINCKVELKIKWTKYCVFSTGGTENEVNDNDNDNYYSYYQRHKIICSCVNLSGRDNKNYQNFLAKNLKDQFIGMSIKQKMRI